MKVSHQSSCSFLPIGENCEFLYLEYNTIKQEYNTINQQETPELQVELHFGPTVAGRNQTKQKFLET